jgi:hypothetical protein
MREAISGIEFSPLLPLWLMAALGAAALLALVPALLARSRGVWLRALAFALVLGVLANPRLVQESREMRPDIALLVVDRSDSTRIAGREAAIAAAAEAIAARAARFPDLELRTVTLEEAGSRGTRLMEGIARALADIPRARLAGVMALTDGQAHDADTAAAPDAPLHVLIPGAPGETDRRLRIVEAPGFGIVGRSVELRVAVEDLGVATPSGMARLTIRRDGEAPVVQAAPVGRDHRITIPITRGGPTVIELDAEERPGEVSTRNNRAVVTIHGVRDRLRVLLVSGEPHAGERTWRRLLKSDPNVDLVHFTILRPPEKDDLTPLNELSLIAFPVRELFQVRIRDFDLIVLDRFANRGLLPSVYLRNIADYVRGGGALLLAVGPEFAGPTSLAATPLQTVLPARPLPGRDAIAEGAFRPGITAAGHRHPVTAGLPGGPDPGEAAGWGRWYRALRADARSGQAVMEGPNGTPLLLLDRVGEGRVALMLSDHIWLWSRGHDGGGPQAELLRRIAHWLMREPELEEEDLAARIEAGRLMIQRRSLSAEAPPEVTITAPDGTEARSALEPAEPGRFTLALPARQPGVWRVTDGTRTAFAAAEAGNPLEMADLRADAAPLTPLARASGGSVRWIGDGSGLPELRRVAAGRDTAGAGWIGLRRNQDHSVTGITAVPLLPGWLALALLLGTAILAWRREGR